MTRLNHPQTAAPAASPWCETADFYAAVLRGIGDGIVALDSSGEVLFINRRATEAIDLEPPFAKVDPAEWAARAGVYLPDRKTPCPSDQLPMARALRGQDVDEMELYLRPSGKPGRWISVTSRPLVDRQGQPRGGVSVFRDVTQQKLAEEALRESELRFRELAEHVNEIFWIVSEDFRRAIYVSPVYERITGCTAESFYQDARSFVEMLHPDDRERVIAAWRQAASEPFTELVYRIVRPDGQVRWLRARVFPIRLAGEEKPERMAGISEDVTDRRAAETALEDQLRCRDAIADLGRLAASPVDPDALVREIALRAVECLRVDRLGYSELKAELDQFTFHLLEPNRDAPDGLAQICLATMPLADSMPGLVMAQGQPVLMLDSASETRFDATNLVRQGIASSLAVPVRFRERVFGTLGVHCRARRAFSDNDVRFLESCAHVLAATWERKRGDDLLRLTESRQRSVLDHLPDWLYTVDRQGLLRFINRAPPGMTIEQLVGTPWANYLPEDYRARHSLALARVFGEGRTDAFEHVAMNDRWWSTRYVPSRTEDHKPFALMISTDITFRKEAELQSQRQQELLCQSLVAHERDRQLVAYEIHDGLVQDVTGGLMHLDAVDPETLPAKAREQFDLVRRLLRRTIDEGRRMISGLRPPIIDELGVVAAIEYLISEKEPDCPTRFELRAEVEFDRLDPLFEGTIYRIVQECLTNVVRHSQARHALVSLKQSGNRLELQIVDDGVGFDPSQIHERRFGLQGVRERARMLHGRADVESAPGKGSRILVSLPLDVLPPPTGIWDLGGPAL